MQNKVVEFPTKVPKIISDIIFNENKDIEIDKTFEWCLYTEQKIKNIKK